MACLQLERLRSTSKPRACLHCRASWRVSRTAATTYPTRKFTALRQVIGGSQGERVYDGNKISYTLSSQGGGSGAKTGLYTFVDINKKGSVQTTDTARALLARYHKGQPNRPAECSGVLESDEAIRIRRLTPRECFRLQGFTDEQFDRAAAVNSETQLYKQAGNAVTVNVVEEIGRHIKEVVS